MKIADEYDKKSAAFPALFPAVSDAQKQKIQLGWYFWLIGDEQSLHDLVMLGQSDEEIQKLPAQQPESGDYMKPFDLVECIKGARALTRDGRYYLRGVDLVWGDVFTGCLLSMYDIDSCGIPGTWRSVSGESCMSSLGRDLDLFMWEQSDDVIQHVQERESGEYMKQFDLESALAGEKLTTRGGAHYISKLMLVQSSVIGIYTRITDGEPFMGEWSSLTGVHHGGNTSLDLFMDQPIQPVQPTLMTSESEILHKPASEDKGWKPDELDPKWYGKKIRDML